jgi:hypothetical protein
MKIPWQKVFFAIVAVGLVFAYTLGIVFGFIPEEQRIDFTTIVLIALTLLFSSIVIKPEILSRISKLIISSGRLELELRDVKERQEKQEETIASLAFVVSMINEEGLKILEALDDTERPDGKDSSTFIVATELQDAIRQICSMGLVVKKAGKNVGDMPHGQSINITEWVKLSEGKRVKDVIRHIYALKIKVP